MGGVFEHREELGTLKEQGDNEKKKAEYLTEQRAHFNGILDGIRRKELKVGMSADESSKKWGKAEVESSAQSGWEWIYIDPQGKRLKNPRIELHFDNDRRLTSWECSYVECPA